MSQLRFFFFFKYIFSICFIFQCLFVFVGKSGQHVALHDPNPPPDVIGYIHTKMSPMEVARNAGEDARAICLREYGSAPDITIYGDPTFTFP